MIRKLSPGQIAVLAALLAGLLFVWAQRISGSPIVADALATLIPAVNLQHEGAYSLKTSPPLTPTMYREPVPVLVTAAATAAVDAALGAAPAKAYTSGERARLLKLQNLFWLTLLCAASFLVTFHFTGSFTLAAVMGVLSHAIFLHPGMRSTGIDSLFSELATAALLVLGSWCYALGVSRPAPKILAAAGLVFGILALTKASMLYVFAGLVLAVPAFGWLRRDGSATARTILAQAGALTLTFALVVAPWMYRNWAEFGTPAISERGGLVLYFRALYNEIDPVEYRGLFYVWAPQPLRAATGRLLGYSPEDLERGGRLFRLNSRTDSRYAAANIAAERAGRPEQATSLMARGRAERVKARNRFAAAGFGQRAHVAADELLKQQAVRKILDRPGAELALSVPALWRGGLLQAAIFACVLVYAWYRRRADLLAFCLPAVGLTLFYALFSVFEPRYGVPMIPVALLAAAIALSAARLPARLFRSTGATGHTARRWPKFRWRSAAP